ncbi:MAG: tandem-95 repeat protein [Holophagales bacterium]|nr:MAG: tandem-95 repeat protein [Holophagales bacterium]
MRDTRIMRTAAALATALALDGLVGGGAVLAESPRIELTSLAPAPNAVPPAPPPAAFPVQLMLDDDTAEGAIGVTVGNSAHQFLWFNRFTRPPGVDLFSLEQIWVLFPATPGIAAGGAIQLVVFLDPDGNPANGANLLGSYSATVFAADGNTFSVYSIPPLSISGSGDVLIGVVDRFVASGATPPTASAALDTTASQGRSWIAIWAGDPPVSPTLPPDTLLTRTDDFGLPGNFMIRGFGTLPSVVEIPALGPLGLAALGLLLALAAVALLRRRRAIPTAMLTLLAAIAAASNVSAQVLVDDFATTGGSVILPGTPAATAAGAGMLGGERDLLVSRATGSGTVTATVTGSGLTFSSQTGTRGRLLVAWDGTDGNANTVAPGGLGTINLTTGGRSSFRLAVTSARAGTEVEIRVYSNAGADISRISRALPETTLPRDFFFDFNAFTVDSGAGANFSSVGAVTLRITGSDAAIEGTVASAFAATRFETALPAVAALKVDLSPAGAPLANAAPGDTVRYRVTITNSGATAQSVNLADTLNGNLALVGGSVRTTPVARPDAYKTLPNTTLDSSAAGRPSLLANDSDADGNALAAIAAASQGTLQGGSVTIGTNGHFVYTPPAGFTGPDSFTYTLQSTAGDPTADTSGTPLAPVAATATVVVERIAPSLTPGGPVTFTEDGPPVVAAATLVVSAPDSPTLSSATVTITNLLDSGAETLAATTGATAITASYVAPTLTLSGSDTVANYQQVLRTVTYSNSSQTPSSTTRSLDWIASDPFGPGSASTSTVNVVPTDDAPVAVADAATVTEDSGANAIDVLANDTDVDGGPKSIASVTQPANGTVVITGGGTGLTYAPNANYCNNPPGTTLSTFTYTLTPGSSSTTVSVTVTCVDDNPVAVADAATVVEGSGANAVDVLANDTDVDGGPKSIASVTQPANGAVVITGGGTGLTYAPNANYCNNPPGTTLDTFTYTLTPGGSSTTVSMTVTCVDDPPVAVADTATVNEDSGANAINVLANDTDIDGGPKSIASVTQPANGAVVITGGGTGLTYAPNANYCNNPPGTTLDTFTYTLTPGSSSTTVTVTVTCVDDNPVAVADAATVTEDSGATAVNVLANDTDVDGGPKSIASVTQPANGTVVITGGGTGLTYAPNANYCNQPPGTTLDTFTYTLAPGGSSTTVTMTVTCVDDNPVAVADAATVTEDSGANAVNVLANDTDVDGGPKSIASVTQPANGAVVITGGGTGLTYAPNANYCNNPPGTTLETFTYTLTPGSSSTTVTVTVTCVDDPPVAVADAATVVEDSGANALPVLANDTDIDGGPKSISAVTQPANGAVVITGGGTGLTYAPNANYCNNPPGTTLSTFTYTLSPGGSSTSVTVTVTCVNDPPVADNDTFDFLGNTELRVDLSAAVTPHVLATTGTTFGVLDGDSDPVEGDAIAVSAITVGACTDNSAPFDCTDPAIGTVHMQTNGRFSFEPAPGDTSASETFQYTVTDNGTPAPASTTATVTLTRFERIWYVDPAAGAGGNGTSLAPFNSFTTLNGAGGSGDSDLGGDWIYLYSGTLAGSIELEANQHLIGQGVALSIPVGLNGNSSPTLLVAAGTKPQLTNASGDTVRITTAIPVEVRGLSLASTTSNAIDLTSAAALTGSSSLAISNNLFRGAGAEGVDVNLNAGTTGTLTLAFTNNSWDLTGTHAGNAVDIRNAAAGANLRLDVSNNPGIYSTGAGSVALFVSGSGGLSTTITGFANNSVHQNAVGSGIQVANATFDADLGTAGFQQVAGGTTAIGASGDGVGGGGMSLAAVQGNLFFTDLDIFASAGGGLGVSGTGAGMQFGVSPSVAIIEATGGPAVDATSVSLDLQLSSLKSTNSSTTGVSLAAVLGTFSAGSGSSISGLISAGGTGFLVNNSSATISYAGTLTTTIGKGVELTTNTGSAISFGGTLTISSGTAAAFTATGGGTVTATDTASTLTTTTGTALNVANTTIGSGGLKFRSITAGTGASGPTSGIILNSTGSSGGLTVSGSGSSGTGGTIQKSSGPGISLTSTSAVNLSYLNVTGGTDDGIRGSSVTGLSLTGVQVTSNGNAAGEAGIDLAGLFGSSTWSNVTVTGSAEDNVVIRNSSGTLNGLTVTGGNFSSNSSIGNDGFLVDASGSASMTVSVTGSTFSANRGDHFQAAAANSGILDVVFSNNTLTGGHPTALGQGVTISAATAVPGYSGTVDYNIDNNSINGSILSAITVNLGTSAAGARMRGTISGNTIGTVASFQSGSTQASGIAIDAHGNGTHTTSITNNTVRQTFDRGINVLANDGGGVLNMTVTGNNLSHSDGINSREGFFLNNGSTDPNIFGVPDAHTVCLSLGSTSPALKNTLTHGPGAPDDFRLRQRFSSTIRLPGYAGATTDTAAVVTFVNGNNTSTTGSATVNSPPGGGFVGGASCPTPP